jgi:hypothetical protein
VISWRNIDFGQTKLQHGPETVRMEPMKTAAQLSGMKRQSLQKIIKR